MSWAQLGQVVLWGDLLWYVTATRPGPAGWLYDLQAVQSGFTQRGVPALHARVLPAPDVPLLQLYPQPAPARPNPPRKRRARR